MRVCLVQLKVARTDQPVQDRILHVESLIRKELQLADENKIDLIVLPETAFCSYCQPSAASALAVAQSQELFIKEWAKTFSSQVKAYLAFGYIGQSCTSRDGPRNALAVFGPDGELVHDRSKRFLYDSDLVWTAERSGGFEVVTLDLLPKKPRVMFAICNDINGKDFSDTEMDKYALARDALEHDAHLIVLSAAWCSAHPDSPPWAHDDDIVENSQVEYWLNRLKPLWGREVYFCCADLVGREKIPHRPGSKIKYCGSSCAISLKTQSLIKPALPTWKEATICVDIPL